QYTPEHKKAQAGGRELDVTADRGSGAERESEDHEAWVDDRVGKDLVAEVDEGEREQDRKEHGHHGGQVEIPEGNRGADEHGGRGQLRERVFERDTLTAVPAPAPQEHP